MATVGVGGRRGGRGGKERKVSFRRWLARGPKFAVPLENSARRNFSQCAPRVVAASVSTCQWLCPLFTFPQRNRASHIKSLLTLHRISEWTPDPQLSCNNLLREPAANIRDTLPAGIALCAVLTISRSSPLNFPQQDQHNDYPDFCGDGVCCSPALCSGPEPSFHNAGPVFPLPLTATAGTSSIKFL